MSNTSNTYNVVQSSKPPMSPFFDYWGERWGYNHRLLFPGVTDVPTCESDDDRKREEYNAGFNLMLNTHFMYRALRSYIQLSSSLWILCIILHYETKRGYMFYSGKEGDGSLKTPAHPNPEVHHPGMRLHGGTRIMLKSSINISVSNVNLVTTIRQCSINQSVVSAQ